MVSPLFGPIFSTGTFWGNPRRVEVSVRYEILHVAHAASKSHPNIGTVSVPAHYEFSLCSPRDNGPAFRTRD